MVIKFDGKNTKLAFCFVDNTWQYTSCWTRELIKNQSDFTITNITQKGYTIFQGLDEDQLLREASKEFNHAVVFSTGTEFINGYGFFDAILSECTDDYVIKGHILDRGDAYYELHNQCYLINLSNYKKLNMPIIGKQVLGNSHIQIEPIRSLENIHDNYTPLFLSQGHVEREFQHKMHGWNIISKSLEQYPILAFNDNIRNNKKHHYPENQNEFLKHSDWIYKREDYCAREFIHTESTEWSNGDIFNIEQVLTPASGEWWKPFITNNCSVIMYDYNLQSINYWREKNPNYKFLLCDLLFDELDIHILDKNKKTLINLSNIFAYEGTAFTHSLEKRLYKESLLINKIKEYMPDAYINFSARACSGFVNCLHFGLAKNIDIYNLNELTTPSWHMNGEWNANTI